MKESNTHIDLGIAQSFRAGRQSIRLSRFDPVSAETTGSVQAVEPLLDCAGAAVVLGGLHPKTVERWAREGRIPAYHYFRHWKFRTSELELWMLSHVNSACHQCRLKLEESDGI
jgi:excisionase family DNA binding protein